jgi:hypothetical protein
MQEHFRGKIIKRMLGEDKFKEFVEEYDKFKAINVYKQVFRKDGNTWTTAKLDGFKFEF